MAHPQRAKRTKIARELSRAAGKETALSVIRSWREISAVFRAAEGELYRRGVATGLGDQPAQSCDCRLVARQAVERIRGVDADRIPAVAEPGRAAERGSAFAADPDRGMRRLHGLGREDDAAEPRVTPGETGLVLGPEFAERLKIFVSDGAAFDGTS